MRRRLTEEELGHLWGKADGRCTYGGRVLTYGSYGSYASVGWEVDHGMPLSGGGVDDLRNMRVACSACNRFKGSMTSSEWLYRINTYYGGRCPSWRGGEPVKKH